MKNIQVNTSYLIIQYSLEVADQVAKSRGRDFLGAAHSKTFMVRYHSDGTLCEFTRERTMSEWQPKITAFLCNWCSYGAADLAGVSRFQYPPNIRVIRVPCSARVSPKFILAAFRHGSDGVWVSG